MYNPTKWITGETHKVESDTKAEIVPRENINSQNHGITIKTTLVRNYVQPEPLRFR